MKCKVLKAKKQLGDGDDTFFKKGDVLTEYFDNPGTFYTENSVSHETGLGIDTLFHKTNRKLDDWFEELDPVDHRQTAAFELKKDKYAQKVLELRNEADGLNAEANRIEKLLS